HWLSLHQGGDGTRTIRSPARPRVRRPRSAPLPRGQDDDARRGPPPGERVEGVRLRPRNTGRRKHALLCATPLGQPASQCAPSSARTAGKENERVMPPISQPSASPPSRTLILA